MGKVKFVLIGDSLVADFDWQARMPFFEVLNLGIPGETAQELLTRLPAIIEKIDEPRVILIMTGTNNVLRDDYSFVETLNKIVITLSKTCLDTEIIVNSLFPLSLPSLSDEGLVRINTEMEELTKKTGSCFLNVHDRLASSAADLFLEDGVHITPHGYELWARTLMGSLAFLLEDDD